MNTACTVYVRGNKPVGMYRLILAEYILYAQNYGFIMQFHGFKVKTRVCKHSTVLQLLPINEL